jgi:hypothetical protein
VAVVMDDEIRALDLFIRKSSREAYPHGLPMDLNDSLLFPPFQIIGRLNFLIPSLTTHLTQKFVQKFHFFCCDLLYQYKFFKNDLNLTMFA